MIGEYERVALVIAPEGTRKYMEYWKTGFYWIAYKAQVPIVVAFLDYPTRRVGFGGMIMPTGDLEGDIAHLFKFYENVQSKNPQNKGKLQIRPHHYEE